MNKPNIRLNIKIQKIILFFSLLIFITHNCIAQNYTKEKYVKYFPIELVNFSDLLLKYFPKLDKNSDNRLELDEFSSNILVHAAVKKYFKEIDTNSDNYLSLEEVLVYAKKQNIIQKDRFISRFKEFDLDNNMLIDRNEASKSFILWWKFSSIDKNKDGYLSPEELILFFNEETEYIIKSLF